MLRYGIDHSLDVYVQVRYSSICYCSIVAACFVLVYPVVRVCALLTTVLAYHVHTVTTDTLIYKFLTTCCAHTLKSSCTSSPLNIYGIYIKRYMRYGRKNEGNGKEYSPLSDAFLPLQVRGFWLGPWLATEAENPEKVLTDLMGYLEDKTIDPHSGESVFDQCPAH